jgi:hypothetical protein
MFCGGRFLAAQNYANGSRQKADFHVLGVWIVISGNVWCGNLFKGA